MESFPKQEETQNNSSGEEEYAPIIDYFFKLVNKEQQTLSNTILESQTFEEIFPMLSFACGNPLTESTLSCECLEIIALEKTISEQNPESTETIESKLEKSVEKLEEIELTLDCLIHEMKERNKSIILKCEELSSQEKEIEEYVQIMAHQNTKLEKYIDGISAKSEEALKMREKNKQIQLSQLNNLLGKYRCQENGFPKVKYLLFENKNEAIRLLNNLDIQIQKLEVEKMQF